MGNIRNPDAHHKSNIPAKDTLDQGNLYLKRFNKIIPEIIDTDEDARLNKNIEPT